MKVRLAFFALLGSVAACTAGPDEARQFPGLEGKADVADQVNLRGPIDFDSSVDGEFVDDLQYDAYVFRARAGAVIALQTSHSGSSSSLDDVLLLYGPGSQSGGYAGAERLASDDNGGWGAHARISGFEVPEEGSYLAIIGTKDGSGRGKYRIWLTCISGDCSPEPPDVSSCDGHIAGRAELCMESEIYDDGESVEDAFDNCLGDDTLLDQFIDNCEYSATPPSYCDAGETAFIAQMIPACRNEIGFEYGLVGGATNADRRDELAAMAESHDAASVRAFADGTSFDGRDGLRAVRESALSSAVQSSLYAGADAWDLVAVNEDWRDILTYEDEWDGFTETREVEWELWGVVEIWSNGEVIGFLAQNEATVSYWDDSDPEDPVNASFEAYLFIDVAGDTVRTLYAGP